LTTDRLISIPASQRQKLMPRMIVGEVYTDPGTTLEYIYIMRHPRYRRVGVFSRNSVAWPADHHFDLGIQHLIKKGTKV
jgi:hypothetical protein